MAERLSWHGSLSAHPQHEAVCYRLPRLGTLAQRTALLTFAECDEQAPT